VSGVFRPFGAFVADAATIAEDPVTVRDSLHALELDDKAVRHVPWYSHRPGKSAFLLGSFPIDTGASSVIAVRLCAIGLLLVLLEGVCHGRRVRLVIGEIAPAAGIRGPIPVLRQFRHGRNHQRSSVRLDIFYEPGVMIGGLIAVRLLETGYPLGGPLQMN
jgi:hypothetical protein